MKRVIPHSQMMVCVSTHIKNNTSKFLHHNVVTLTHLLFHFPGGGSIFFLDVTPNGVVLVKAFDWTDALFDVTWSENSEQIAVTGSGDGSLQVWDITQPQVRKQDR